MLSIILNNRVRNLDIRKIPTWWKSVSGKIQPLEFIELNFHFELNKDVVTVSGVNH